MIFAASLAILKTVFRLRLRGSDACGLFQDTPIFRFFFAGFFHTLVGVVFFLTCSVFCRFRSQFGAISEPFGPHFFEVFPGLDPIGPVFAPLWPQGGENGAKGL